MLPGCCLAGHAGRSCRRAAAVSRIARRHLAVAASLPPSRSAPPPPFPTAGQREVWWNWDRAWPQSVPGRANPIQRCPAGFIRCRLSTNLVLYLTRVMGEESGHAALQVSLFSGTCYLTPLLGAWLADSMWGRYKTIMVFSLVYFVVRGEGGWSPALGKAWHDGLPLTPGTAAGRHMRVASPIMPGADGAHADGAHADGAYSPCPPDWGRAHARRYSTRKVVACSTSHHFPRRVSS